MGASEAIDARLPLSPAQLGIWLGQQLDPLSPAYWTAEAVELQGALDLAAFGEALTQAISDCEALHMRCVAEGDEVWQIRTPAHWALRHVLLDSGGADSPEVAWEAAWRWLQDDLQTVPDLEQGPLFATALLRLGPTRHLWVLRAHHVALDGYGYALLLRRVAALYSIWVGGAASPEADPPRARLAAVLQETQLYQQTAAGADRAFWLERLRDAAPPVTLAAAAPLARGVRRLRGELPPAQLAQWQAAARACGVDWAAWLLAAIAAWLARNTQASEVILGLPVMIRLGSQALSVPCMAMNIVALRLQIDHQQGMAALAARVAGELRAMRSHQRYRYECLRQDLAAQREGAARTQALFGPVVNLMPFERPVAFGPLRARQLPVSAGPVEDLSISIVPHESGVRVDCEANPMAYDATLLSSLRTGLVEALDVLSSAAQDAPLHTLLAGPPLSIVDGTPLPPQEDVLVALRAHAARMPDAAAIEQCGQRLGYGELLIQVQQLAAELARRGVGPESRVAVLLPRAPQTVVALLAILWAGGAYVPLDPDSPAARIAMVLEDATPALLLTHQAYAQTINAGMPVLFLDTWHPAPDVPDVPGLPEPQVLAADALAYMIYTSGTTGRPNGVMIPREALAHFVAGARERYAMRAADRVLQFAPLHFDASVEEIFVSLSSGACLVLRTEAMLESVPAFLAACEAQRISVLDLPTAFWHELAYSLGPQTMLPASLRLTIIGGEAALAERVLRWRAQAPAASVLLNTYGPTETTVICTTAELAGPAALHWEGESVPIGAPLPGLRAVVVDAALQPVRRGESGELCLIGGALARGYYGREAVTAARFVRLESLPGAPRAYRTGDRVRLREDGALVYLGRLDEEFKISGYRIDPSEIETALLACAGVREAAVLGQVLAGGSKRLVAFIVMEDGGGLRPPDLQAQLARTLPAPAVPGCYLGLSCLPRNANNKIDRAALRVLAEQDAAASVRLMEDTAGTGNALEQCVMAVWREVLGLSEITLESDFFALGGKSLQAIQVANRLGIALQREVPVSSLFRHPSVAALAAALDFPVGHEPPARQDPFAPLLCLQPGEGPALFCVHPAEGLSWCYMGLAAHLRRMPIYGLQASSLSGPQAPDIAQALTAYLACVRSVQPHGPYHFLGWSSGGGIAHALAARLQAAGEQVSLLAMMDAYPSDIWAGKPPPSERDALVTLLDVIGDAAVAPDGRPLEVDEMRARLARPGSSLAVAGEGRLAHLAQMSIESMLLYRQLRHPVFVGEVLFFLAAQRAPGAPDWRLWQAYVQGAINKVDVASTHNGMSRPLPLAHIGRVLAARLEQA